jgi:glycosyltransferase involved in cell wall biosynthesis
MRVVHFVERCNTSIGGGVITSLLDMCGGMAAEGHQVTLITSDTQDVPAEWLQGREGCPSVIKIESPVTRFRLLSRSSRLTLRAHILGAELVHLHGIWEASNVQVASIARELRCPYVVTAHGMLDEWCMSQRNVKKRAFLGLVGNTMLRRAEAVHCTARGEADQAASWTSGSPTHVVPYMMDMSPFRSLPDRAEARARFGITSDLPVVAFISRIHYKKGLEHLIEAAANLRRIGRPVHLLVAGSGDAEYEATLRAQVKKSGIESTTTFVGFVRGEDKIMVYRAADMMALPTYQENFGLVLTESLACETPVITTKAVDIWPELEESGSAILLEKPDWAPLADAIAQLVDDPVRRLEMGRIGRQFVFGWVSPKAVVDGFERLYRQAVNRAGAARRSLSGSVRVARAG